MKTIILIAIVLLSHSAFAFETLDSTLSMLKKTGIEAGGMDFKCPEGFTMSKELSNVPSSFSKKQCERTDKDIKIIIQVESIPAAKKNRIGRVFYSFIDFSDNKNCSVESLKKFISPRKPTKVVNQSVNFDLGQNFKAFVACVGVGSGIIIDVQTKIWAQIMN